MLDNAETLIEAVKANTEAAIGLAQFLREHLASPSVSLLITSREFLGWDGEVGLERDLAGPGSRRGSQVIPAGRATASERRGACAGSGTESVK